MENRDVYFNMSISILTDFIKAVQAFCDIKPTRSAKATLGSTLTISGP